MVDAVSVLGTHLSELIRRNAHELFSRQDAKRLLDRVAVEHPKVVEDLVPKLLPLAAVQRVLQNLLRERVSIRDAVSILEALGEAATATRNPVLLTEYVRQAIRRTVVKPYLNRAGELPAWFLDPAIEQAVEVRGRARRAEQPHRRSRRRHIREILNRIPAASRRPKRRSWPSLRPARATSCARWPSRSCPTCSSWRTTRCRPACACSPWETFNEADTLQKNSAGDDSRAGNRIAVSREFDLMRIKSYYSLTMEDAMAMARRNLGPDAMLVNSRQAPPESRHLGEYEVVFATDAARRDESSEPATSLARDRQAGCRSSRI